MTNQNPATKRNIADKVSSVYENAKFATTTYAKIGGALLAITLLAPGCAVDTVKAVTLDRGLVNVDGECSGNYDNPDWPSYVREQVAWRCQQSMVGDIALVSYGLTQDSVNTLADHAEEIIPTQFDGIVAPRVDVIPLSPEAESKFIELNPNGCVDMWDVDKSLSKIADETMDLSKYAKVIGASTLLECGTDTPLGGINHFFRGSRYSMLSTPSQYEADPYTGPYTEKAMTVAHEYGHSIGLGHAGKIGDEQFYLAAYADKANIVIDLNDTLSRVGYKYDEFGDKSTVMGFSRSAAFINAVQRRRLTLPQIVLDNKKDPQTLLSEGHVTYTVETAKDYHYAALNLHENIVLSTPYDLENENVAVSEFDQLVLEPAFYMGDTANVGVVLYLANSENAATALFGYVTRTATSEGEEYQLKIGTQTVAIRLADDSISFREVF